MTGGQALARMLRRCGIDTLFGIPGIQLDFLFDALWEERARLRVVHPRHEQATAYMADGYARAGGRIGTCVVVPGPGLLNAAAGLATAYACSSPVLCVTGQIPSDQIGLERGALHEIKSQLETISSVVKRAERALRPEDVPGVVERAHRALVTGRPRPVEIEVPPDVLERVADVDLVDLETLPRSESHPPDPDLAREAAALLGRAERPLICAGGGVLSAGAWSELAELAGQLEAPVLMTSNGRGAVSDRDHRAHTGALATRELVPKSDVVLAVGTRLLLASSPRLRAALSDATRVVQIDVDPEELGRNRAADVAIAADARAALGELLRLVPRYNRRRESREDELRGLQARAREAWSHSRLLAGHALAIRDALPDDGVFVTEYTQVGYWCSGGGFPVYAPRTFLGPGYQGALGFGFPTALGAQVALPDRAVVSISGDGGFLYNAGELATLAQHRIPVVAVVFDDGAFGNVRRIQELRMGGHTIATELRNPRWPVLADAFGVAAYRADDPGALRKVVSEALERREPALVEVPLPPARDLEGAYPIRPLPPRPTLPEE